MGYGFLSLANDFSNDLALAASSITENTTLLVDEATTLTANLDLSTPAHTLTLMFINSGRVNITSGKQLTFPSTSNIIAPPRMNIFGGGKNVAFKDGGEAHLGWWGLDFTSLTLAISVQPSGSANTFVMNIPEVEIICPTNKSIYPKNAMVLRGQGVGSIFKSAGSRTLPMLHLSSASNVLIENILLDGGNVTTGEEMLRISGNSQENTIQHTTFKNGHIGIRFLPGSTETQEYTVEHTMLFENTFEKLVTSICFGDTSTLGDIQYIKVLGNTIDNTALTLTGQTGIAFKHRVKDILLEANTLVGSNDCGIDLGYAGDRVSVVGNIIAKNGIGIRCEHNSSDGTHQIVITGNIIQGNEHNGVLVNNTSNNKGPYLIDVSDNEIFDNKEHGVICQGRQVRLSGNNIHSNATDTSDDYAGVYVVGQSSSEPTEFVIIANNQIVNNGSQTKTNCGLLIGQHCNNITITGNTTAYDTYLPNGSGGIASQNKGIIIDANTNELVCKNNTSHGIQTGANPTPEDDIEIADEANILGETISCELGTYAGTDVVHVPLFVAPSDICIVGAVLVNAADIPASPTQTFSVQLYDASIPDPANHPKILEKESNTTPAIEAFKASELDFVTTPKKYIAKDSVVTFYKGAVASSSGTTKMRLILHYVTF